ncbi:M23 family metallopeptidase [Peptococcus simiae]|uniref:M23 family metallopeptidase n=1 Tax=Peptococcus simiae TaxID=1643805 RepID=A0ABW9H1P9_9FIRM
MRQKYLAVFPALLCALAILLAPSAPAQAAQPEYAYIPLKSAAVVQNDGIWLPLRSTFTDLNMDLEWRAEGQDKIKLTQGRENYEMQLSQKNTLVTVANGQQFPLVIKNGASYAPLSLFENIINRNIGLSGNQMLVLVDGDPNWQLIGGIWTNQKPMWAHLNAYQAPQAAKVAPPSTTNPKATSPTPAVAQPKTATTAKVTTGDQLIWPTTATYISSPFGERIFPLGNGVEKDFHTGVDIAGCAGDPIFAAASGTVTRAEVFSSYGNCVDITHPSGLVTRYAHLATIGVQVGQQVGQGQTIGTQGMTGAATGPHLHFETRVNGKAVDPDAFIHYRS